jgi:hypothetical protein
LCSVFVIVTAIISGADATVILVQVNLWLTTLGGIVSAMLGGLTGTMAALIDKIGVDRLTNIDTTSVLPIAVNLQAKVTVVGFAMLASQACLGRTIKLGRVHDLASMLVPHVLTARTGRTLPGIDGGQRTKNYSRRRCWRHLNPHAKRAEAPVQRAFKSPEGCPRRRMRGPAVENAPKWLHA